VTFHAGYATSRISSILKGRAKQFGWLQTPATIRGSAFNAGLPLLEPPKGEDSAEATANAAKKRASWRLSRTALAAALFRRRFPREMGQSWSVVQPKLQLKRRNSRIRWMRPSVLCFAPSPCRPDRTAMEAKALGKVEQRSKAGSLRFFRLFDSLGIQPQKLVLFPLREQCSRESECKSRRYTPLRACRTPSPGTNLFQSCPGDLTPGIGLGSYFWSVVRQSSWLQHFSQSRK